MNPIHIITITDGNINDLTLTLKSINSQNYQNFKNIIISKTKIVDLNKKLITKKRLFYYKKNSSIYEAMNYGIKKSKNNYVFFLNAGDIFSTKSSLKKIKKNLNPETCLMCVSILKNNNDYFIPKKNIFFSKNFLSHNSFIRPPNKGDLGFNTENKITADGEWMKYNIKKFRIKKIYSIITIFYLGGISSLPSKRSIQMKLNTGKISIMKELLKLVLLKIVGKKVFFKIIYYFKYNKINPNLIK